MYFSSVGLIGIVIAVCAYACFLGAKETDRPGLTVGLCILGVILMVGLYFFLL